MHYIICDDNSDFAQLFRLQLKEERPNCKVTVFTDAEALLFNIEDMTESADALFIDIKLPRYNGIDVASKIFTQYPMLKVVFVTGYGDEYSEKIFDGPAEFSPIAYLVKPVNKQRLRNTLDKIEQLSSKDKEHIALRSGNNVFFVPVSDIYYIATDRRKLCIHKSDGAIEIYGKLSGLLERLPAYFSQCHRQFAVNIKRISAIESWETAVLTNGKEIPISKTCCEAFKKAVILHRSDAWN